MTRAFAAILALLTACSGDPGASLAASEVAIFAPIPGQERTVAYLTLDNRGAVPVTLDRVTSPQFTDVQMHATILDGGVAAMQALDAVTIAENSRIAFAAGANHLMLIAPTGRLEPGDTVTLELHFDRPGTLIISAPLQSRAVGASK